VYFSDFGRLGDAAFFRFDPGVGTLEERSGSCSEISSISSAVTLSAQKVTWAWLDCRKLGSQVWFSFAERSSSISSFRLTWWSGRWERTTIAVNVAVVASGRDFKYSDRLH